MNKVAHYLQQHVLGEIVTAPDAVAYFSHDDSIFSITPQLAMYPRVENDIRKAARFTWQLAEKGRVIPMTVRGNGLDVTGAAIGEGIVVVTPAHLNNIIEFDPKSGVVVVEPGVSLDKLQQTLLTHGRFLPPVSDENRHATVGGAVSNNDMGRASYKYGPMMEFVRGVRMVLANGEHIETGRLSKRELNKKLGLASFEGEVYRALDKLIEDAQDTITANTPKEHKTRAGYRVADVKLKDSSFDITPLVVGAQGTLGVITEITLETLPYNPSSQLLVAGFGDRMQAWAAVRSLNELAQSPAAIDFIDGTLIQQLQGINPGVLKPLEGGVPAVLLFIDIDDDSARGRKKIAKKITKILESSQAEIVLPESPEETASWQRLRDAASFHLTTSDTKKKAIPFLDDAFVPPERMVEFCGRVDELLKKVGFDQYALWGQAGLGLVHTAPLVDITAIGDRQRLFKLMDAYYRLVVQVGGSVAGSYAEGRVRSPFVSLQYDEQMQGVFSSVKRIFDPYGTLNPGVKVNTDFESLKQCLRSDYTAHKHMTHLPRG